MSRPADGDPADGSEAAAGTGGAGGTPDASQPLATQEEKEVPHLQEQVCVLKEQVSNLQVNQQVKQKAHDLEEENSRRSPEIHHLKQEAEVLKEQVYNLQVKNQQVKQKARDQEEENSHLSAEIHHLKQEAEVLKEQVSILQVENQQVKQKARDQEEENFHLSAEIHHLKQEAQVLKEQMSIFQVENQQVKQKARDLEEENSHLLADITKANQQDRDHLSAEKQRLKEQVQVLMEVMNHLLSENLCLKDLDEVSSHVPVEFPREAWQDHDQDMALHLSAENQRLKEQVQALVGVVSHQLAENKQLRQQHQDQEGAVSHPKREIQKVRRNQAASGPEEAAKNIIPSFPPVSLRTSLDKGFHVQIRVAGKTGGAEKKFLKDIKKLLSSQSVSLKAKEFTETSKDLLLVFCPIASSMGTDIKNALEGISRLQKVLLVVMHYVRKDITEIPIDPKQQVPHPALVQAVHTRYTLQDGFYPCEMNQRAMADVADAIKKFAEDN